MKSKHVISFFIFLSVLTPNLIFLESVESSNLVSRILIVRVHSRRSINQIFPELVSELEKLGYFVEYSDVTLTSMNLEGYSALVIYCPTVEYSEAEKNAIYDFVRNGGGLLIIGEVGHWAKKYGVPSILNDISKEFGIQFNIDCVNNPSNNMPVTGCPSSTYPVIHVLNEHPVTKDVSEFFFRMGMFFGM